MRTRVAVVAVVCAGWLSALGAYGAEQAKSVPLRIGELLDRATSANTLEEAEKALTEAEQQLRRGYTAFDKIGLAFAEADIKRTRARVYLMAWQRDAKQTDRRDEAKRLLSEAHKQYEDLQEEAQKRAGEIAGRFRGDDPSKNAAYREARGYRSRANYSLAWTEYNLGLASEGDERKSHLDEAIGLFKPFTHGGYQNHPIVADCFLGQALCYFELGQHAELIELLEPADAKNTPSVIFKRMTYLLLNSYQQQARHRQLDEAADKYFAALPQDHALDSIELGMAVEWARSLASLAGDPAANPYYKHYQSRLDRVAKLVYPYGDPWRQQVAEALGRTAGSSLFACLIRAREDFTAERYEAVLRVIAEGLKTAGDDGGDADEALLADLRHTRAAAAWNLKRWHEAYAYSADFARKHSTDRRASDMVARALQAGLNALEGDPPREGPRVDAADFLRFLTFAEEHFPNEPEVGNAGWYRGSLLLKEGKYREAEEAMKGVGATSPAYRRAQYGLAVSAYRQAEAPGRERPEDAAALAALLKRAAAAVKRYVDLAGASLPEEEHKTARGVIDVALATGQRLLDLPEPDHAAALELLQQIEKLAQVLKAPEHAAERRLALGIEAYVLAGRLDAGAQWIDVVLNRDVGGAPVARAFANVADSLEERYESLVKAGRDDDARRLGERLVKIYTFLDQYVSRSKDRAVAAQAVAVRRRLARALQRQGRDAEAISHYDRLLKEIPPEKAGDVLRGLAMAYEQTERYDEAVEPWRKLAKGLDKGTEGWLEARYHLVLCHDKAGRRDHARNLLAYVRLQCPQIDSETWRQKFDALERALAEGGT